MRIGGAAAGNELSADGAAFPAQSSVLDERALLNRVVRLYDVPPVSACRFLMRGDADVYRLTTARGEYYLKVRRPPVTLENCQAEAAFVSRLADEGLPVVRPVRLLEGGFATQVRASEGPRPILVFESAPPALPVRLDGAQARQLGTLLARIHVAADRCPRDPDIPEFDPDIATRAVADVIAAVALSNEQIDLLRTAAQSVAGRYRSLLQSPPAFGVIHGDFAPSNMRLSSDGTLWLFDFGAIKRGWRLNELLNVRNRALVHSPSAWDEFLAGYSSITTPPARLDEFEPTYRLMAKLHTMGYICNELTLRRGLEPIEEFNIAEQVDEVRRMLG